MAEQPLFSDHETASVLPAPAQRVPPEMPRARRRPWFGITLVRLAVLIAAGVIVVLFATQWDRWVGLAVRQVTDDASVAFGQIPFCIPFCAPERRSRRPEAS
jgi:hypothetical protein